MGSREEGGAGRENRIWDPYLEVCKDRGISLNRYFGWPGPETHRQFLLWQDWRGRQWNNPSLTDHYLMQLTMVVRQLLAKNPRRIKMEHQRLRFRVGGLSRTPLTKEEATRRSKAVWLGTFSRMGIKVRTLLPDGTYEYQTAAQMIKKPWAPPSPTSQSETDGSDGSRGERGSEEEAVPGVQDTHDRDPYPFLSENRSDQIVQGDEGGGEEGREERGEPLKAERDEEYRTMFSPRGKRGEEEAKRAAARRERETFEE